MTHYSRNSLHLGCGESLGNLFGNIVPTKKVAKEKQGKKTNQQCKKQVSKKSK